MEEKFLNKKFKFSKMDLQPLKADKIITITLIMEAFSVVLIPFPKEYQILMLIHHFS
jgi:hypothetical protein